MNGSERVKMAEITETRVSSSTSVKSLAGWIANYAEEGKEVRLRAIGASAVNQMYKALAIASGIVAAQGTELLVKAGFKDLEEDGEKRTAMTAKVVIK